MQYVFLGLVESKQFYRFEQFYDFVKMLENGLGVCSSESCGEGKV